MSAAPLESWTRNSLSRILAKTVTRYLKDEEHRREFERWYYEKYGKKYEWKKRSDVKHGNQPKTTPTPCP